jgi:hypothetical protein
MESFVAFRLGPSASSYLKTISYAIAAGLVELNTEIA